MSTINLKGKFTLLIGEEQTRVEVRDSVSEVCIVSLRLNAKNFQAALSRVARVECDFECDTSEFSKIGKRVQRKTLEFEMPKECPYDKSKAVEIAKMLCPTGWEPVLWFSSKDSFFSKDGKEFARCDIKHWE